MTKKSSLFFIVSAVIFMCAQVSVRAQSTGNSETNKIQWGLRGGLNLSNTNAGFGTGSTFRDPSFKLGLLGGITVQVPLNEALRIQPEISLSSEGALQEGLIGNVNDNKYVLVFTTQLSFLNIPVMLQYNKGKGFYAETGPQLGILLQARLKNAFPAAGAASETEISDTKNAVMSWASGIGYQFEGRTGIGLRYTLGLANYTEGVSTQKVNTLQLLLHYRLSK